MQFGSFNHCLLIACLRLYRHHHQALHLCNSPDSTGAKRPSRRELGVTHNHFRFRHFECFAFKYSVLKHRRFDIVCPLLFDCWSTFTTIASNAIRSSTTEWTFLQILGEMVLFIWYLSYSCYRASRTVYETSVGKSVDLDLDVIYTRFLFTRSSDSAHAHLQHTTVFKLLF
jgi:hypothetical protein